MMLLEEPSSYVGRFFINIQFPRGEQNIFKPDIGGEGTYKIPILPAVSVPDNVSLKKTVMDGLTSGFSNESLFPHLKQFNGVIRFVEKPASTPDAKSILEAIRYRAYKP